jgi:NitT/TauT family transport system substrate-binding protein
MSAGPITIGTETWPGYLALYVAQEKGYYRDEGLDVRIKRYVALGELSKDYLAGKMQARANLTLDAVNERLQGLDHRAVLAIDYSNGSDAIAAREGIGHVKDFAGRRVGYEPNTLEEFFLSWALAQNGLSLRDVISVPGNPEQTVALLKSGKIDVAVTHEPFLSAALQPGKIHAVYSSAQAPGLITDILTFRSDFIESRPAAVEGVIRAYFRALDFWKKHPREAHAVLAREFGTTPKSIQEQMKGIRMLDLRDNRTTFSFASGLQSLYGNMRKTGEFVQAHQEKNQLKAFATDDLIESSFIRTLFNKHPHPAL